MFALCQLVDTVVGVFIWLVIGSVILSWLVSFNVVDPRNRIVYQIGSFLQRVTEPALRPIRNLLPSMGGLDISPVILIIGLMFLQNLLLRDILRCY